MMFWIAAAFLTFLVTACVLFPLTRGGKIAFGSADYDREVYRARIQELEYDLAINRISEEEAEAAKAEEGRRLIVASKFDKTSIAPTSSDIGKFAIAGVVTFIPLFSIFVYLAIGVPSLPDQSLQARNDLDPERQNIARLLERAEAQLVQNPDDGRGWEVVAPVYLRQGRIDDGVNAYRNAIRLLGETPQRMTSLGEALVIAAQGIVTAEAFALFKEAASRVPSDAKPKFFLAIALGQNGEHAKAVSAWQALLENAPEGAVWVGFARASLNEQLAKIAPTDDRIASATDLPGPTKDDIDAAGEMSAGDRGAMITGMVASLAEKLNEDPNNEPGWRRLIRSYIVLGKPQEAQQAIAKAKLALPDNEKFQEFLVTAEQSLLTDQLIQNGKSQ